METFRHSITNLNNSIESHAEKLEEIADNLCSSDLLLINGEPVSEDAKTEIRAIADECRALKGTVSDASENIIAAVARFL